MQVELCIFDAKRFPRFHRTNAIRATILALRLHRLFRAYLVPFNNRDRSPTMRLDTMENLFLHEIKELHNAEKQLLKALPKMAKAATSDELRQLFEQHLEETKAQVDRLDQIFQKLDKPVRGIQCKAMEGLIEEGDMLMSEEGDAAVKDAALIGAAQRVEHYEIAGYGCARTYAEMLGMMDAAEMLQATLDEEKAADEKLNDLALSKVNAQAAK
jgi:ferritin-like metal-binding protein YciE